MRGSNRRAQNCSAQNRGEAPSPSLRSTSPRTRGEVSADVLAARFAPELCATLLVTAGLDPAVHADGGSEKPLGNSDRASLPYGLPDQVRQ